MPRGLTHAVVGLPLGVCAAALGGATQEAGPYVVLCAVAGAMWADWDKKGASISTFSGRRTPITFVSLAVSGVIEAVFGHRGAFHSLLFAALFSVACYLWLGLVPTLAFATGYLSHLLLDHFFTKSRVPWFWPFGRRRDRYGRWLGGRPNQVRRRRRTRVT